LGIPASQLPAADPPLNCRYGVAKSGFNELSWLSTLGAGWFVDFSSHPPPLATSSEYVQVIRVLQNKVDCTYLDGYAMTPPLTEAGLGSIIAYAPGATWIVGNEPDRGPNPDKCKERGQDDTYPEVYARAYHDAYQFIKAHDPTALVANAGLVQVTPGRLQYLDKMWNAYVKTYGAPMPVDVWNMHLYVLPETTPDGLPNGTANVALGTDPALGKRESGGDPAKCPDPNVYCYAEHDDMGVFAEQVTAMRNWMKQRGQQNKPLILSEYSLLYPYEIDPEGSCFLQDEYEQCFTPNRVSTFMQRSFDYLESAVNPNLGYPADGYRLIQRWLWFSVNTNSTGSVSNLADGNPLALTQQGVLYRNSVIGRGSYVNLSPDPIVPLTVIARGALTSASVTVRVHNTGTTASPLPFTVTFYSDAALTKPIGSVGIPQGLAGCAGRGATATVTLADLPIGSTPFWVWVDSGGAVVESNEGDNVASGIVRVYPYGRFLPFIFRQ
jgi:hypothetical protein